MKSVLLPVILTIWVAMAPLPTRVKTAHIDHTPPALSGQRVKPKLLALLFRADWCRYCKVLEPEYAPLKQSLQKEPILFVRFDFTNAKTSMQARELAARLGVGSVFDQFERSTGFALLVKPTTNQVVGIITIAETPDQMRAMFMQALKQ
ncbi:MAG: thioredoxin domain-containing protein [Acidobacteriaceae bacterium]